MEERILSWTARMGPALTAVVSALLVIVGVLIILQPMLLAWLVGLALVLAGVAVGAVMLTGRRAVN